MGNNRLLASFLCAYLDLDRALRALWRLALIATLITVGFAVAQAVVPPFLARRLGGRILLAAGFQVGYAVALAPFLIATHRFILLGEVARGYLIALSAPRFQLFAGWLAVVMVLADLPSYMMAAMLPSGLVHYYDSAPPPSDFHIQLPVAAMIAIVVFLVRVAILFPAVAVDAPGAIWQNAILDTRGQGWFVFSASLLPVLPFGLLAIVAERLAPFAPIGALLLSSGLVMVLLTLGVVILSRLYQALGERLNRPVASA